MLNVGGLSPCNQEPAESKAGVKVGTGQERKNGGEEVLWTRGSPFPEGPSTPLKGSHNGAALGTRGVALTYLH